MQKITKNIFSGGMNTDVDRQQIQPNFFTDSQNIEFTGDGVFLAAKNIRGTTNLQDVINIADTHVLGVFETEYKIGDVSDVKCLTIITATVGGNFKIWCYDLENDDLYELYEEATPDDYISDER